MSIFVSGGSGLLGKELQKHIKCDAPPRTVFDLVKDNPINSAWRNQLFEDVNLIVHAAAYTDVLRAETEKELCYQTNVIGTRNLASLGIPMLYISTEYVFDGERGSYDENDYPNPQNFYALTKLLGEYEARRAPQSTVIRCLFKPRPFEHPNACVDQWTSGTYADAMAKEISLAISCFDMLPPTIHIGTERKSTYELAKESRPDVGRVTRGEIGVRLPMDTSLNVTKWKEFKDANRLC